MTPSATHRLAALDAATGPDRESAILAALEDEAPTVRERAVRLAARYVEPQVLGALVGDGVNATRRNGALSALERQGPYAVPHLVELLSSTDSDVVMFALQVLARIGDPVSTARILPLLQHADANVAQAAVEALGRMRARDAVPALLGLLNNSVWLQLAAVNALGEIGDPRGTAPLLALVPDSFVAEQAVRALQRITAPESLGPLLDLLVRVRERPLRDAVLEASGVVLELHPDAGAAGRAFGRALEPASRADLVSFLGAALAGEAQPELSSEAPAQAAAGIALVAELSELYVPVLRLIAARAGWAEPLWRSRANPTDEQVATLLAHSDAQVRRGLLLGGRFSSPALPALLARLDDPDAEVRAAACRAIGALGDARAAGVLIERLRTSEGEERDEAAAALGRFPADALSALGSCLDPRAGDAVAIAALETVRLAQAPAFEPEVLALSRAPAPDVRLAALRAAAALPGSRTEMVLFRALADREERVQIEALDLLVDREGDKTATALIALLSAADSLRFRVIRALGRLRSAAAAPKLESLFPSAPLHEQIEIVRALATIGQPGVTDFLRARLESPQRELRHVAALGLARAAGPSDLPTLLRMAGDDDWTLRNQAAQGLGRLGLAEGRATLLTLTRDVEPVVARTARQALALMAERAGPAAA
ncbi:MAG TPA: HEAT repeat domain-containing protein [Gemmatimonadales bacterium]|nr:HEAT repeat domain-containing protein [Gemmatimonadales bacterium]